MSPLVGEIRRVVEIANRRQSIALHRVAELHRGVAVRGAERQVLRHAFDEPQWKVRKGGRGAVEVELAGEIELKGVNQLVGDHVLRIRERSRQRQHDPSPQRLGDAAGAFAEWFRDDVGLLEVCVGGVDNQRLAAREGVSEQVLEPRVPPFGDPRGQVDAGSFAGIKVDVKVLGLEHLKIEGAVPDLVASEVLRRGR
jgi:hypothetical protein